MTAPVYTTTPPPDDYTYEDYLAEMAALMAATTALSLAIAAPYQAVPVTPRVFTGLLAALYPVIERARTQAGQLARNFYDSERARQVSPIRLPAFERPDIPILGPDRRPLDFEDVTDIEHFVFEHIPVYLSGYDPNWFQEAMRAAVPFIEKPNSSDDDLARVISIATKEVEQGGRKTMLRAVETDPKIVGWARVEGNENIGSCGFCSMLISRGPVYKEAEDAGLDVHSNEQAVEIFRQSEDQNNNALLMELMNRWHENCDCKVVPVFDRKNWHGRDQYIALENLWKDTTRGLHGNDALNAFRRAVENGDGERALAA